MRFDQGADLCRAGMNVDARKVGCCELIRHLETKIGPSASSIPWKPPPERAEVPARPTDSPPRANRAGAYAYAHTWQRLLPLRYKRVVPAWKSRGLTNESCTNCCLGYRCWDRSAKRTSESCGCSAGIERNGPKTHPIPPHEVGAAGNVRLKRKDRSEEEARNHREGSLPGEQMVMETSPSSSGAGGIGRSSGFSTGGSRSTTSS